MSWHFIVNLIDERIGGIGRSTVFSLKLENFSRYSIKKKDF